MLKIINARVTGDRRLKSLFIKNNIITNIYNCDDNQQDNNNSFKTIDLQGDYISLGGVDLQINGALGLAFPDLSFEDDNKLHSICQYLWSVGVDKFLPTIVTTSIEKIQQSLKVIANFQLQQSDQEAEIIGVHLEGPFLNEEKKGAHPQEYLLPLNIENVKRVLGAYQDIVKVITLAPELDLSGKVIPYLKGLGIVVSLGHSLATAEEAKKAFDLGASMVTHAFNAMPSLHHRQAGLLGEAIISPHVYCGLIADGNHVCPTMLKVILSASNYEEGIFLVSDALSPIGLDDGCYPWDNRTIEVKHGTARLPDGTLSGTTLPLFVGTQNLVNWNICTVESAIALVTDAPRRAMSLPGLERGVKANLIRWQYDEDKKQLNWERLLF